MSNDIYFDFMLLRCVDFNWPELTGRTSMGIVLKGVFHEGLGLLSSLTTIIPLFFFPPKVPEERLVSQHLPDCAHIARKSVFSSASLFAVQFRASRFRVVDSNRLNTHIIHRDVTGSDCQKL